MHARKMAAALQAVNELDPDRPVLLYVERDSGHGQGKPISLTLEEQTDQWMFLRHFLGVGGLS